MSDVSGVGSTAAPPAVAPSAEDPVVHGLVEAVGGPPGRYAAAPGHRFWTPTRVVLAVALAVLAAAWVQKAPCREHAWAHEYQYTHTCYTDVFALYFSEELAVGKVPYLQHEVEYPVLTGAVMQLVAWPARTLFPQKAARWFFDLTALLLAACALVTVWAMTRLHRRRPWDAAMVAAAPLLLVTAYVNWDLVAIALSTVALLAWARRRLVWAGVLLGLGVAAKFYPVLFLGALLVLCLRAGRMRAFAVTAAAATLTWLVVNVPVALAAPHAWARFFVLNETRDVDWGTFWYVLRYLMGRPLDAGLAPGHPPTSLNLAVASALLFACTGIALLVFAAPRRPRLGQVVFLVVAVFLLTNKVWSQQYVLWLVPLAVLARPRWGPFLVWQAGELAYFFAFYFELVGAARGTPAIPEWLFILASGARAGGVILLVVLVVVDILRPGGDVVRASGADDPAGGVLDGAPDVVTLVATPAPAAASAAAPAGRPSPRR